MTRSVLGALLVASAAVLTLPGCTSKGSFEELDKAPLAFQRDSALPRAQVVACISERLARFGGDFGRFPDFDFGVTRLTLGGKRGYHYENFYRIDVLDATAGSRVSVRRSKAQDSDLPAGELANIVTECAG